MTYDLMLEKVKTFLGEETKGMISSRTKIELQDNGDIYFRQNTGVIDGVFYFSKASQAMFTDFATPLDHLKTLADVREFFGMEKLYTIIENEENVVEKVCDNCNYLKEDISILNEMIASQKEKISGLKILEGKLDVYTEIFSGRNTIHIEK